MEQKFDRIAKFVDSLESKELNPGQQALLVVGGATGPKGTGNNCKCNGNNCNCSIKQTSPSAY